MIKEINERIRNKEQFIENVERYDALASSATISVKNVCLEEVVFLKELLKYVDALILEKDKYIEFMQLRLRIAWAAEEKYKEKVEVLQKEIAELNMIRNEAYD